MKLVIFAGVLGFVLGLLAGWSWIVQVQVERDELRKLISGWPQAVARAQTTRQAWLPAGVVNGMKVYVVMEEVP